MGGFFYALPGGASKSTFIVGDTDFQGTDVDLRNGQAVVTVTQTGNAVFYGCQWAVVVDYDGSKCGGWSATTVTLQTGNSLTLTQVHLGDRDQFDTFDILLSSGGLSGSFGTTNLDTLNLAPEQTTTKFKAKVPS